VLIVPFDKQVVTTDIAALSKPATARRDQVSRFAMASSPKAPDLQTTCAVVVTYHPDAALFDRLKVLSPQVHRTVIVDNGSSDQAVVCLREIASSLGCHVILNSRNEGIAQALNRGADWAVGHGYSWMLMLDQDTAVSPEIVASLGQLFLRDPSSNNLAIIGSNYIDKATGKLKTEFAHAGAFQSQEMVSVLTSGSLLSLSAYQILGRFRDDFFIDCVDHEYCLRARSRGYRVIMTSHAVMTHGIGNLTVHKFLWKTIGASNHDPSRQYFMARNTWILAREYLTNEPRWILRYLRAWLKSIVVICLFERHRCKKLKNITRGCIDGLIGRARTVA
jgi:rhamnosyltransferase